MNKNKVVLGLDGLSIEDLEEFSFAGEWDTLDIETYPHTAPSWNAIFSGREVEGLYDFFKTPDFDGEEGMLAQESDTMWTYEELQSDDYVWERIEDLEVVSAPVSLEPHTYTTLDEHPGDEYTWASNVGEVGDSIQKLSELTLNHDRVITVIPQPDHMNHLFDNPDKPYTIIQRQRHMAMLMKTVETVRDEFDEWIILSDHGRPKEREFVTDNLWIPAHDRTGVIQSNGVDVSDETNISVCEKIYEFFND